MDCLTDVVHAVIQKTMFLLYWEATTIEQTAPATTSIFPQSLDESQPPGQF